MVPGGQPRQPHFCDCIIISAFNFVYIVAILNRPIGLFCFCAVLFVQKSGDHVKRSVQQQSLAGRGYHQ